jgi:thiol-disulfide isomerase/thioredoxin
MAVYAIGPALIAIPWVQLMNQRMVAIFVCAAIVGCDQHASAPSQERLLHSAAADKPVQEAAPAPASPDAVQLKILDFAGLERLIASKRGQVVVVDAWSTACPPCMRDFPQLVALDRKYAAKGLACISLSFDYEGIGRPEEQSPRVLEFLRKKGATFDNVLSSEDPDAMYKKLDLASVPAVFVYDRKGKLRERLQEAAVDSGEKSLYDRVEILVAKLLAAR